jgi:hypothetical protein
MASRWIVSPVPSAQVTPVDREEVEESDGRRTMVFETSTGVRFVRITEPSGYVYWLQEVKA